MCSTTIHQWYEGDKTFVACQLEVVQVNACLTGTAVCRFHRSHSVWQTCEDGSNEFNKDTDEYIIEFSDPYSNICNCIHVHQMCWAESFLRSSWLLLEVTRADMTVNSRATRYLSLKLNFKDAPGAFKSPHLDYMNKLVCRWECKSAHGYPTVL